jgi:hypothetical protein
MQAQYQKEKANWHKFKNCWWEFEKEKGRFGPYGTGKTDAIVDSTSTESTIAFAATRVT